eukprot:GHVT01044614.1.p1 GENE.GHVT01044614.1~~GHVT01044614.1.p1  ORF type:complete len:486 (+),score=111.93 GHVT01044614.1:275-1732(+)
MDKMIQDSKGGVIITNDGATILKEMCVTHPTARMFVELSKSQDIEAGDGTTSVVVMAGAMLEACEKLLGKGLHPQVIGKAFREAADKGVEVLQGMSRPVDLADRESLIHNAVTSLSSKVVSQSASLLAPLAVDAILRVIDPTTAANVDLNDIRVNKIVGGTVDDTELVDGLIFTSARVSRRAPGCISRVEKAKIGLIQFCLSAPKTDIENSITVKDYHAMDRLLREERTIIAKMIKQIQATGCNVLLIQKSILRDAVNDLSLDYLAKAKILVVRDIEREDVEFISRTVGCEPVASLDHFTTDRLGYADLVHEESAGSGRIVRVTGVQAKKTVSVLVRASNQLILDEAERSLHDALCVVRSLVKIRALLPGGGAPEMEVAYQLQKWARSLSGSRQLCVRAYAEALELLPYTLAENAGLVPLEVVTLLRSAHAAGDRNAGIHVTRGGICNMMDENVLQPVLVTHSALKLATETVIMILKIDDIVLCR